MLPITEQTGNQEQIILDLVLNKIMPVFFLMIPIMASSVMAASSFVGEKEKHTLETLLYSPLSLKQLFQSKIVACFSVGMMVSFISFAAISITVRGSAKAQTMEEAQQSAVFLIFPIIALVIGQFTGVLMISTWLLLGLGIVFALLAAFLMKGSAAKFTYEKLLRL